MDIEVDVEGEAIFLEGEKFLIPLSEQQAIQIASRLEQAVSQLRQVKQAFGSGQSQT